MRINVLTQVYWPDDVSTAQHLVDLCEELAAAGAEVSVIASHRKYEDRSVKYPLREERNGVSIRRLRNTGFGKRTFAGRLADFASFNFLLFFAILFGRKPDLYLGMTSPPMVSFVGAMVAKWKRAAFCYWTMDLQPELSIRSGLIREGSLTSRWLTWMGDFVFRNSNRIVVLDKYMRDHAIRRGARPEAVAVVPVWPVMSEIYRGRREENPFRIENGLNERQVIMYSGNHSYVHPLDTVLEAARMCSDDEGIVFTFIGGGVRARDVIEFRDKHGLSNIVKLPFQPRERIHISLGAADVQLVVMGDGLTGFTHPNKVYGAMFIGKPIVYIGPTPSHISDLLAHVEGNIIVNHGESARLADAIRELLSRPAKDIERIGMENLRIASDKFHPDILKAQMKNAVISTIARKVNPERKYEYSR